MAAICASRAMPRSGAAAARSPRRPRLSPGPRLASPRRQISSRSGGSDSAEGTGRSSGGVGESARDAALRMEQEALDARTAIRLASLRARKDEERAIQQRAVELQKELAIREEGRRRAEETGGRRPTQRKAVRGGRRAAPGDVSRPPRLQNHTLWERSKSPLGGSSEEEPPRLNAQWHRRPKSQPSATLAAAHRSDSRGLHRSGRRPRGRPPHDLNQ